MAAVPRPTQIREEELRNEGYQAIAGVDEAGRGPLAGPVVAAAVLLPEQMEANLLGGLHDSKLLTENVRAHLYELIVQHAVAFSVGSATEREIDETNILQATLLAMKRAVERLEPSPGYVLVDGNKMPPIPQDGEAIIKGDQRSVSIAAASIVAKVTRDRIMESYHHQFPQYGFDLHKGYPTAYHKAALRVFGACQIHRSKFKGVSEHMLASGPSKTFTTLHRRLARRLTIKNLTTLLDDITKQRRRVSEDEFFVLHDRVKRLLTQARARAVEPDRPRIETGMKSEDLAARYLEESGYSIWERNYRAYRGEIDIIANRGDTIVIVEVRSRRASGFGEPWETIGERKKKSLYRTAERYLVDRSLSDNWNVRFDVVSITNEENGDPKLEHFEDAFRPGL